jgi:hypothetical protein
VPIYYCKAFDPYKPDSSSINERGAFHKTKQIIATYKQAMRKRWSYQSKLGEKEELLSLKI